MTGCAEQYEAIAEMLSDLEGRFIETIDNTDWTSFTPEQRCLLKQWHIGTRQARHILRHPYVI